jgi:hypothetical protein
LDVSWYLTYKLGLLEALLGIALRRAYVPKFDLFDEQDLSAYVTNAHHSLLKAVENTEPREVGLAVIGFYLKGENPNISYLTIL